MWSKQRWYQGASGEGQTHSARLECSHAAESCWTESITPFLKSHSTCTSQGTARTACVCGSDRMSNSSLPYQNTDSLKASPSLTHLCTPFPAHTQCRAQCLAYNQYNKYLFDGLIKTLYSLVSNMNKWNKVQNTIETLVDSSSFILWILNFLPYPSAF